MPVFSINGLVAFCVLGLSFCLSEGMFMLTVIGRNIVAGGLSFISKNGQFESL